MPIDPQSQLSYSSLVRVDVAALSDKGKVRSNNEDHFLVARTGRHFEVLATNLPQGEISDISEEIGYGLVVADGMGGEKGGEVASRLAIRTLVELVLQQPEWIMRLDDELAEEAMRRAKQRFREVNAEVTRQAAEDPTLSRMGTTMTMAYSLGPNLFVVHVGDSRAYRWHRGELQQLTHDHTLAQTLRDLGEITQEEAASNRLRHVLTNCLGRKGDNLLVDVQRLKLADGDCLLLCSDGLTEMVEEEVISDVLSRQETAEAACRKLVDLALEKGAKDNVTVIVARYRLPDAPTLPAVATD